jgi:hypothetical protein
VLNFDGARKGHVSGSFSLMIYLFECWSENPFNCFLWGLFGDKISLDFGLFYSSIIGEIFSFKILRKPLKIPDTEKLFKNP